MSFLDDKIFGLIRSVADATNTYTARQRLKFTGSVTLTDDPTTNTTTVNIAGGGGGGGSPWNAAPANIDLLASSGSSALYARGDHVHALRSGDLQAIAAIATGPWNYNSKEIQSLGAPTTPNSAARLQDVQSTTQHAPVRAIDGGYGIPLTGLVTVDGVALSAGDRYGRLSPGDGANTGIWLVQTGAHTRPGDWANGRILKGDQFTSTEGTNYGAFCWLVTNAPSAAVGMDTITFLNTNKDDVDMYGDVHGPNYNAKVFALSGDPMSQSVTISAPATEHLSAGANTHSKVYHLVFSTTSTAAGASYKHLFRWPAGSCTAIAQVNMHSNAGVVEAFHVRETRKHDGVGVPNLIGAVSTQYEPTTPTGAVSLVWSVNGCTVQVTAPSSAPTRWAVNLQVFGIALP